MVGPANYGDGAQPVPVRYEYDSLRRLSKITDPLGHVATTVYDALSRAVSGAIDGVTQQTFAYTTNGQLLSVTDARNKTTQYQYDGFDRGKRKTYADSTYEEVVAYDSRDNVLQALTRAGHSFAFTFDALSQLLTKTPAGQPTVTFTYDGAGRLRTVSTPLVAGDPSTGTFTVSYDTAGRMFKEEYPDGKSVIADLDKNGNVVQLKYPDLSQVTNAFDQLDRVTSIAGFNGSVTFGYDTASRRVAQMNGNKTGQGYAFDKVDSLLAMTIGGLKPNISLPMAPRVDFAYGYSDVAQDAQRRCSDPNFVWAPTLMKTITYGAANNINQYPTVDSVPLTYDNNGGLTNDGVNTYAYNAQRQLVSVTGPSSTVSYKYDPLGRLVEKTVGTTKRRYLYAGLRRIEEYDGAGMLLRRYVYGAYLDECLFVVNATSGNITYLHADETGSTIVTTDASGMPTGRNVYTPWGELVSGSLADIGIGFTGQFYDQDVDLYFYKGRHYSAKLGRFLQTDPIGYAGGLNLYEYCSSDPVNFKDPLGLRLVEIGPGLPPSLVRPPDANQFVAGQYASLVGALGSNDWWVAFRAWLQLIALEAQAREAAEQQAAAQRQAAQAEAQRQAEAQAAAAARRAAIIRAKVEKYQRQGNQSSSSAAASVGDGARTRSQGSADAQSPGEVAMGRMSQWNDFVPAPGIRGDVFDPIGPEWAPTPWSLPINQWLEPGSGPLGNPHYFEPNPLAPGFRQPYDPAKPWTWPFGLPRPGGIWM